MARVQQERGRRSILDLHVDPSLLEQARVSFNAGSLTDSIVMDVEDYLKIASPTVFDFSIPD